MQGELQDDEICDVIKNYPARMKRLQDEIESAYVMLANISNGSEKDELIQAVSMSGEDGHRAFDLDDVLDEYQHFVRKEKDRMRRHIRDLVSDRERMNRIMEAYNKLSIQDRILMEKMLSGNDPPMVRYMEVAEENFWSRATVLRIRRQILDRIKENFGGIQ
ncbi:MAG: hypothetical protein K6B14_09430 [Lachnospiraceae bacterium]|nr:hypothetical protein [Lachnospiraceae bacterium]